MSSRISVRIRRDKFRCARWGKKMQSLKGIFFFFLRNFSVQRAQCSARCSGECGRRRGTRKIHGICAPTRTGHYTRSDSAGYCIPGEYTEVSYAAYWSGGRGKSFSLFSRSLLSPQGFASALPVRTLPSLFSRINSQAFLPMFFIVNCENLHGNNKVRVGHAHRRSRTHTDKK